MIPAEACLGTFVTLKGACGKTTTTKAAVPTKKPTTDNNGGDPVSNSTISDYFRPKAEKPILSSQNVKPAEGSMTSDYSNKDEALFGQLSSHHEQNMSLRDLPEEALEASHQAQVYSNQDNGLFDKLLADTSSVSAEQRFVPLSPGQDYNSEDEQGFAHLLSQTQAKQNSDIKKPVHVQSTEAQPEAQNSIFNDKDLDQFKQLMADKK